MEWHKTKQLILGFWSSSGALPYGNYCLMKWVSSDCCLVGEDDRSKTNDNKLFQVSFLFPFLFSFCVFSSFFFCFDSEWVLRDLWGLLRGFEWGLESESECRIKRELGFYSAEKWLGFLLSLKVAISESPSFFLRGLPFL